MSAMGSASAARASNRAKQRQYEYENQVRENQWMRDLSVYGTKKIQFSQQVDESNIAAQRAYTQSQINYNRVRAQAMLDHQTDFKEFLKGESKIESGAAHRGIGGKSVARMLTMNLAKMGMANRQRARALTDTQYRYKEGNEQIRNQLKGKLNQAFGKVAIVPTPGVAKPPPVLQNPNQIFMLGMAKAAFDGMGAYAENKPKDTWADMDYMNYDSLPFKSNDSLKINYYSNINPYDG